ncbi:MAG TPA: hypothetical protein VK988_18380, partial [Acidimicrobiales bacterium]|nr:hypothetical protein [Acidimicrobiales bacterium]
MDDVPAGAEPAPIRRRRSLRDRNFDAYGFPTGYDDSVATSGTLGVAVGRQWVQVEATSGLLVERGFSGGPAWSAELGGVVAMLVTRDTATGGRVAFAIPLRVLADTSPAIRAALPSALELDPDLETHWLPRARGLQQAGEQSSLFTGRREALAELAAWLVDDGP